MRGELRGLLLPPEPSREPDADPPGSGGERAGGSGGACGGEGECVARASGGESGSHRGEAHRHV